MLPFDDQTFFMGLMLSELRVQWLGQQLPIGPTKLNMPALLRVTVTEFLNMVDDLITLLVYQSVMTPTQQYQIIETGFAAIAPVLDVVRINKPWLGAPGKATAVIPASECPPQRWWDGAGLAANIQHIALTIFQYR
jgi:hypothetical protein